MPEITIEPCPFCGSENVRVRRTAEEQFCYCAHCFQRGPSLGLYSVGGKPTEDEKVSLAVQWNTRYSAKQVKGPQIPQEKDGLYLNGRRLRCFG